MTTPAKLTIRNQFLPRRARYGQHDIAISIVKSVSLLAIVGILLRSVSALCSYPLKLGSPKFLKVKAQFSLNFVPNFKILVLTG